MSATVQEIKFNGMDFIIPSTKNYGPIVTKKQYQNGKCSYAILLRNGRIIQLGKQIGTIEDIKFGEIVELEIDYKKAFAGIIFELINYLRRW